MDKFDYHEPRSLQEAMELLDRYGETARVLAGGTDLIVQMRHEVVRPQNVVNIKTIPELHPISVYDDTVEIGAAATMFTIEKTLTRYPEFTVLCEAMHTVASCQIRNRATLVGNICNASPAADTIPALYVLDARVKALGPGGERIIPIDGFFAGPRRTTLAKNELVVSILLPRLPSVYRGTYLKKARRPSVDLATASVAASYDGEKVKIALGAVAPTVVRATESENRLLEEGLNHLTAAAAARLAVGAANPISDLRGTREYRLQLVEVLTERALTALYRGHAQ